MIRSSKSISNQLPTVFRLSYTRIPPLKGGIFAPFSVLKRVIQVLSRPMPMSDVITWELVRRAMPTKGT